MRNWIRSFLAVFSIFVIQSVNADEDGWNRVYLASYPRSGNHWVRFLVEEATHIVTGSIYCDQDTNPPHSAQPLPWGYSVKNGYKGNCRYPLKSENVLLKTHYPYYDSVYHIKDPSIKAIRIVRHPIDTFWPEHFTVTPLNMENLVWPIANWRNYQEYWNNQPNVVTFRYEDLFNRPKAVLRQILDELGYSATDEDIARAVAKNPPKGALLKHLYKFNDRQRLKIATELRDLMEQFDYSIPGIN